MRDINEKQFKDSIQHKLKELRLCGEEMRRSISVIDLNNHLEESLHELLSLVDDVSNQLSDTGPGYDKLLPFSLPRLCHNLVADFARAARDKGIELSCHIDDSAEMVFSGDPDRVKAILTELLTNALNHTEQGEIILTANFSGPRSDGLLWLAVNDTGCGISEKQQKTILEAGTSPQSKTPPSGLAHIQQLIRETGGQFGLQSKPGKGSTFWLALNMSLAKQGEAGSPSLEAAYQHKRILMVEDNPATQRLLSLFLSRCGCHLDILDNGSEALEALKKSEYDLIFMDFEMPGLNGAETTKMIREKGLDTAIIALTANAGKEAENLCLEAGMNDFLNKPFQRNQIFEVMEKWLGDKPRESVDASPLQN